MVHTCKFILAGSAVDLVWFTAIIRDSIGAVYEYPEAALNKVSENSQHNIEPVNTLLYIVKPREGWMRSMDCRPGLPFHSSGGRDPKGMN
jgi:hypothetical protein